MLAVELLPEFEKQAGERQGARSDLTEIIPEGSQAEAREKAAELAGTNPHYVSDAKRIKEEAPELAERVKSGEVTIPAAKKELEGETTAEAATRRHLEINIRHGMVLEGWKDTQRNRSIFRKAFKHADMFFLVGIGSLRDVLPYLELAKALSVANTEEVDGWIQACRDAVPAINRVRKELLQHQEAKED